MLALLMSMLPVLAPMLITVAAPAKFTVVALAFHKFCVVCVELPTTVLEYKFKVLLELPMLMVSAARIKFTVVALASHKFCVA